MLFFHHLVSSLHVLLLPWFHGWLIYPVLNQFSRVPLKDVQPDMKENLEQKVNDAISMIPSLITGLDVNVRFTG